VQSRALWRGVRTIALPVRTRRCATLCAPYSPATIAKRATPPQIRLGELSG
jgi:hypothetical protein